MSQWLFRFIIFILFFCLTFPNYSGAYLLNGRNINDPQDAWYWVDTAFNNYPVAFNEVVQGIESWDNAPEIEFTQRTTNPASANIKVEWANAYYGDYYGYAWGDGHIAIYKKWLDLSPTREIETIVHEVGHELGLAHTQVENNNLAVMRKDGWNDKTYPLSDDFAGISAIY
jgi:hypothetical protein